MHLDDAVGLEEQVGTSDVAISFGDGDVRALDRREVARPPPPSIRLNRDRKRSRASNRFRTMSTYCFSFNNRCSTGSEVERTGRNSLPNARAAQSPPHPTPSADTTA
jgi:hypothetical protein